MVFSIAFLFSKFSYLPCARAYAGVEYSVVNKMEPLLSDCILVGKRS